MKRFLYTRVYLFDAFVNTVLSNEGLEGELQTVRPRLQNCPQGLWSILLPAALPAAHSAGISVTHGAILWFFAPQGHHVAPMGWNFAWRSQLVGVIWSPKLKILCNFGIQTLGDYYEIFQVCARLHARLVIKIWVDSLKGLRSLGVLI